MTMKAKTFLTLVIVLGCGLMLHQFQSLHIPQPLQFASLFAVALLASGLKVTLPGVTGTMSVYFLFLLIGMVRLTPAETLVIGLAATLIQCFWHAKQRPRWFQVLFNLSSTTMAVVAACNVYGLQSIERLGGGQATRLGLAAAVFFVLNTAPVAAIIGLTEGKGGLTVWRECYFWCFPYYLVGATIAALYDYSSRLVGWDAALLAMPVVYLIYHSYKQYLGRLEGEKDHAEQMASLHLRTIEALALAIDAKDHTTHEHLQRVQVYAMGIGEEMGLVGDDIKALQAASLLHDIGKLAVPEHIISKPGRLTPEEFEKMKIHPVVGAEILERAAFPYPVAPIVRSHHEKWDGTGYPIGLKGDEIPIGARILAAVDCFDALACDRQYRRALPLPEALAYVKSEVGTSFDPEVVRILEMRWRELEHRANHGPKVAELAKLSRDIKIEAGAAPDAGFVNDTNPDSDPDCKHNPTAFLSSIAAARHEVQSLYELAQELGQSLSLNETLSVLASRLKGMVPYDALAIYVRQEDKLIPTYVAGQDHQLFSSLRIPVGQGLSGWVAENNRAIVNGNPSVEPGYLNDPAKFSTLQSALAIPLEGANGVIGVLALYHASRDAFSRDQLRILQAIGPKLSVSIENAFKYREATDSATTDYLTGLPNARSLFFHLDSELSRAKRNNQSLSVLVCDLDRFKQVNDRFGHLAGNRLLSLLATRMKEVCRDYDYLARMGGDEFVLVLPNLTPDVVERKIEQLNELTVEAGLAVCGDDIVSLSVGTATYPLDGSDAEDLLAEADRNMYRNKQKRPASRPQSYPLATLLEEVALAGQNKLQTCA